MSGRGIGQCAPLDLGTGLIPSCIELFVCVFIGVHGNVEVCR